MARISRRPRKTAPRKGRPRLAAAKGGTSISGLPPTPQERQDRARRMARAYWALAQCSRALVRAAGEEDLLRQLCRILVQVGEYHMAWVGYAVDDPERSVRAMAQAGFSEGYVETIHVSWADVPSGRGPVGTAIRTGRPFAIRNARTDPRFEPWREQAIERGYASVIGLPIQLATGTIGVLVVYSARVDAFDPDEEELLIRLTEDVSFGIGALRDRAERERAEKAMAESEELFRTAFEEASVGKAMVGVDGRYLRVNRAFSDMLGYSREELLGMHFANPTHPDDRAAGEDASRRMLSGERSTVRLEKRYLRKDGSLVRADICLALVRAPDGSPRYFVTDVQDVTARHRAEEQLRMSRGDRPPEAVP